MKKLICALLVVLLILSISACGEASFDSQGSTVTDSSASSAVATDNDAEAGVTGPEINISYASQVGTTNNTAILEQAFFDDVAERTNGLVTFTPYWSGSLVKSASAWSEVIAGTADAVTTVPGNELDHFIVEATSSYFTASNLSFDKAIKVAEELWYMTPEWQAEFEDLVPLTWDSSGGELYIMSNVPINSLEDIKGKSFRCVEQNIVDLVEALGGIAIKMPLSEVVDSISKGIICGTIQGIHNMTNNNFIDVCDYVTGLDMIAPIGTLRFMREDVYEAMSDSEQDAFDEAVKAFRENCGASKVEIEQQAIQECKDAGVIFCELSEEDIATIWQINAQLAQDKAVALDAMGYNGTEMYENALKLIAEYSK